MANPTPTLADIAAIVERVKIYLFEAEWVCLCPHRSSCRYDSQDPLCISITALLAAATRGVTPANEEVEVILSRLSEATFAADPNKWKLSGEEVSAIHSLLLRLSTAYTAAEARTVKTEGLATARGRVIQLCKVEMGIDSSRILKLEEALRGVIRVADRKTDEFDAAHAALAGTRAVAPATGTEGLLWDFFTSIEAIVEDASPIHSCGFADPGERDCWACIQKLVYNLREATASLPSFPEPTAPPASKETT